MREHLRIGNRVGIFLVLLFFVCYAWYFINPVHRELHLQLFEISFIGFRGLDVTSVLLGVLQSYLWGHVAVFLFCVASCCKKACPWCAKCCAHKCKDEVKKPV